MSRSRKIPNCKSAACTDCSAATEIEPPVCQSTMFVTGVNGNYSLIRLMQTRPKLGLHTASCAINSGLLQNDVSLQQHLCPSATFLQLIQQKQCLKTSILETHISLQNYEQKLNILMKVGFTAGLLYKTALLQRDLINWTMRTRFTQKMVICALSLHV